MNKKSKSSGKKFLSVFLSVTTTLWLVGGVAAQAATLTQSQIDAIITLLQSFGADTGTVANVQSALTGTGGGGTGGGSSAKCTFTRPLTVGSTGNDVMCLQEYLNSAGFQVSSTGAGSPGNETTYFGSRTQSAVAAWQAANGVAPAVGYFGSISQAKYNMLMAGGPGPTPTTTPGPTPPPGVGTGLTVSAGTQPSNGLAVQNAINVPYTRVRFTASSDGDVTVNSLTVERFGQMQDAIFSGVILLDENGNRLGTSKTLNSDHRAVLNEPFVVKAGQSRDMTIAGDLASSLGSYAGQVGGLSLVLVNTSATVNGSLPINGAIHTVNSSLSIGSVTLTRGPSDPNSTTTKDIGTTNYIFSSIKSTAGSAEDVTWKSVRFYQTGSIAAGDIVNVVAKDTKGNSYPVTVSSDGKYYTANLGAGILIKKGLSEEVWIQGDITGGSNRTIAFDVWDLADVVFTGGTYGHQLQGTKSTGWTTAVKPRYQGAQVTVGTGSLVVSKASSVASQNIVSGGTGVVLGGFEFEGKGEPITFTSWVLTITTTDSDSAGENGTITNVTVYDQNGKAVAGPQDFAGGVAGSNAPFTMTFTDSVTVPVGKNVYTIKGNLNSNWENNDTIQLSIAPPSSAISNARGETTNSTITPSPSSTVAAQTMTVKAGALSISPDTSFATTTVIANSSNTEVGRFRLDATASGDDLKIKTAKLRKNATAEDNLNNLALYDGTKKLNTSVVDPTSTAEEDLTFTFDDDLVITKGTTKTLSLKGDFSSNVTSGAYWKFDVTGAAANNDWGVRTALDGADITETLSGTNGKGVSVLTFGTYKVAFESIAPVSNEQWVYGGQKMVTMNILKFTATSEAIALTDLRLQIDQTGSSTDSQYEKIYIYDGVTLVKETAAFNEEGQVDVTFNVSGDGSFIIPKDGSKYMTIKADISPIAFGASGVVENWGGGNLLGIDYDKEDYTNKQKGQGQASGTSRHSDTGSDVTGNGVVAFRAVPQIALDTSLSSTAGNGDQPLIRFKVRALGGDIKLNRITFSLATSGIIGFGQSNASTGFRLRSVTNANFVSNATGAAAAYYGGTVAASDKNYADTTGTTLLVRALVNNTTNYTNGEYNITEQSGWHTFELWGNMQRSGTNSGSLTIGIEGDDARPSIISLNGSTRKVMAKVSLVDKEQQKTACGGAGAGKFVTGTDLTNASSSFIWTDISSLATSATNTNSCDTADWMNGFKVSGLDNTGLSTSRSY